MALGVPYCLSSFGPFGKGLDSSGHSHWASPFFSLGSLCVSGTRPGAPSGGGRLFLQRLSLLEWLLREGLKQVYLGLLTLHATKSPHPHPQGTSYPGWANSRFVPHTLMGSGGTEFCTQSLIAPESLICSDLMAPEPNWTHRYPLCFQDERRGPECLFRFTY